jgi:hypothetical protein
MSYVLANASRLKPEIRLAQAVSQFEADLSIERKIAFVPIDPNRAIPLQIPAISCDSQLRLTAAHLERSAAGVVLGLG